MPPFELDSRSPLIAASAWLVAPAIALVLIRLFTHIRYVRLAGRDMLDHLWSPHVATTIIGITFVITMAVQ